MRNYTYKDGGVFITSKANMGDQYGIGQYCYPANYELVDKVVTVVADKEYELDFKCKVNVVFDGKLVPYKCIKCDPGIYLVLAAYDLAVLNFNNGAAVLVREGDFVCGTIKGVEGAAAPACAGDEMVGTKVRWVFGCSKYVNQDYTSADRMNVSWAPRDDKVDEVSYKAVKISDSFYLVSAKSDVLKNTCAPFFTDRVILLEDYRRSMAYGAVFGKGFEPIMVTGYAKFL